MRSLAELIAAWAILTVIAIRDEQDPIILEFED